LATKPPIFVSICIEKANSELNATFLRQFG
jgi:hypothetical protein